MPGVQSQQSVCWVLCGIQWDHNHVAMPRVWQCLMTPELLTFTYSDCDFFNQLFCENRPKRQLQSIYAQLEQHNTLFSMRFCALLQSPPSQQSCPGLSQSSTTWTQMGSWAMVSLPQMNAWGTGCFLQTSFLPLIIALTFTCLLLLFSHLFPNTSLVTGREQKQRRWFIQTKWGLNFVQLWVFSEREQTASRASSTSPSPHCHPNITPIFLQAIGVIVKKVVIFLSFWAQRKSLAWLHARWQI